MRILLVEDEPEMADALTTVLRRHDMIVDFAPNLSIAREALEHDVHDVVLIDRQLPDGDGITLVPRLRARERKIPVIVISALGSAKDRISGLDNGADDYLPKPFEVDELLARIRAVLRRSPDISTQKIALGHLDFDIQVREAYVGGVRLALTRRELLILESLLRRPGRTILKNVLEDAVYAFDDEIASNSLEANVSRLRKKLIEAEAGAEIHNIRGVGYFITPSAAR
ncbi:MULTISPECIES: response regulator transcription factor [Agrobacterium]|uniref:Transcriptional regulator n=1 Tax=Agrobacterium arsenijevicii TaxID=1585697 RepID=A0ABR5D1G9_9HYPH|nr:response regulator transcription factor [Agrobacterium fabrum]KJF70909.1 transcriptional regulator [Agrobacterium arsenijevicii]CUX58890.1 putative two-component response regulator (QseB/CopT-like) [Agrobacterium fabrum str. J-07]